MGEEETDEGIVKAWAEIDKPVKTKPPKDYDAVATPKAKRARSTPQKVTESAASLEGHLPGQEEAGPQPPRPVTEPAEIGADGSSLPQALPEPAGAADVGSPTRRVMSGMPRLPGLPGVGAPARCTFRRYETAGRSPSWVGTLPKGCVHLTRNSTRKNFGPGIRSEEAAKQIVLGWLRAAEHAGAIV